MSSAVAASSTGHRLTTREGQSGPALVVRRLNGRFFGPEPLGPAWHEIVYIAVGVGARLRVQRRGIGGCRGRSERGPVRRGWRRSRRCLASMSA